MTDVPALPGGAEWTAVVVAAHRAAESLSERPAFRDPLAEALLSRLGLAEPGRPPRFADMPGEMAGTTDLMGDLVVLRTLHYDTAITDAGLAQVVLLGAGLDGRAYRLPWAGRLVFELDLPGGLRLKEEAARTEADLLMVRAHGLSAPGSRFYVEIAQPIGARLTEQSATGGGLRRLASVLRYGPPTPPHLWMAGHGWSPDALTLVDLGRRYGREVLPTWDPSRGGIDLWYFDAEVMDAGLRTVGENRGSRRAPRRHAGRSRRSALGRRDSRRPSRRRGA